MFQHEEIMPSTLDATVKFIGQFSDVQPTLCPESWERIGDAKVERCYLNSEWQSTTSVPPEIEPSRPGFWMWGDVLVRVIPSGMRESVMYFFKRRT